MRISCACAERTRELGRLVIGTLKHPDFECGPKHWSGRMGAGAGDASRTGWTWLVFGFCSLLAVLIGCWSAAFAGVTIQPLALNVLAWTIGAALAVGATRIGARWTIILLISLFALLMH